MNIEKLLHSMLTENTGRALGDSGDAYGRNWEKNKEKSLVDFQNEPEVWHEVDTYKYTLTKDGEFKRRAQTENELLEWLQKNVSYSWDHAFKHEGWKIEETKITSDDINFTVSVFHYLSKVLELDEMCEEFNKKPVKDWEGEAYGLSKAGQKWLEARGFEIGDSFNTYNGENNLSQVLQYTLLKHGGSEGDYILLQIHGGCDVRGGYTDAKLVKLARFQEYLDSTPYVSGTVTKENGEEIGLDTGYHGWKLSGEDGEVVEIGDNAKIELSLNV